MHSQNTKASPQLRVVASLPKILKEASGLEVTGSGLLWTHNDDRLPVLYALDTTGQIVRTVHLNHPNNGWEDLTRDDHGNLYIGAFGNNKNDRKNLMILKLPDPDSITSLVTNAELIEFSYSDQRQFPPPDQYKTFDADAFVSLRDSLYIFTKNRTRPFTGYSKIYRVPSSGGKYQASLYDSLYLGVGEMIDHWVTSADVSPDGKVLVLLSLDCMWLISDFYGKRFSEGKIQKISLTNFTHKTGICFVTETNMYLVDELELGILGGQMYSIDIAGFIEN